MGIRWKRKVEVEQEVELLVDTDPDDWDGREGCLVPATLDDLRKACEAVGLHSLLLAQLSAAEARTTSQACSRVATETRAVGLMAENGELRSALRQALTVGLAECERLRGEVNSAVHETGMRRAWALDLLRQPGESRADCARRLATERDATIARAEKAEALHSKAEAEVHEPSDLPRATDEDLVKLAMDARDVTPESSSTIANIALAVAARVRREQCLVTRAVEMGWDIRVQENDLDGWNIGVHPSSRVDERFVKNIAPSDVARVLAEMLGEVVR